MMKSDANVSLRFLLGGATLLVLGIALSATGEAMFGSLLTIVGVALLVSGLHTFGRAGPDTGTTSSGAPSSSTPSSGAPSSSTPS
ncbi:MAG TPA: hypothetical protein VK540_08590 [Polyangiaceae bacterium]|jgi:hypothetical protein|nr:hypothetical protein [Polyangiaceae bacterium]